VSKEAAEVIVGDATTRAIGESQGTRPRDRRTAGRRGRHDANVAIRTGGREEGQYALTPNVGTLVKRGHMALDRCQPYTGIEWAC